MRKFLTHASILIAGLSILPRSLKAQETATIINQSEGSITFVVDENLPAPQANYRLLAGNQIAKIILNDEQITKKELKRIVATSFDGDSLMSAGSDVFFQCMVRAYADHRPVSISPDMVWLLVSQGFARYVNEHPDDLRDQLVSHADKIDLIVESQQDLLSGQADWPKLLDGFTTQIEKHTKGDIANTITADFSTTGLTERLASEITLMESVKSYFNYKVLRIACGIPNITLKGTQHDWQKVIAKTRGLAKYGLREWVESIEPILTEFIHTAEGKPNQQFWQSIVKKQRVDKLMGGGCGPNSPTVLDGWLLKLFPDKEGATLDSISTTKDMPSERVRVSFKYNVIDPAQGTIVRDTPMELLSGFVGIELDSITGGMTPKIGWMVRIADEEEESLDRLRQQDEWNGGIHLSVDKVPEILQKLKHIHHLQIDFTGPVVLPKWMDTMTIENLHIHGNFTKQEGKAIRKRFPQANLLKTNK